MSINVKNILDAIARLEAAATITAATAAGMPAKERVEFLLKVDEKLELIRQNVFTALGANTEERMDAATRYYSQEMCDLLVKAVVVGKEVKAASAAEEVIAKAMRPAAN